MDFIHRTAVVMPISTRRRGWGLPGVIRRFWVVPNPEIGFRPLSIPQISGFGNELAKSIFFEQSRVVNILAKTNCLGKND
jgi:hypothetical protein